ncbi:MAG: hypothetical protein M0Z84_06480 [Gammaproteobacteria bacterium]|nr:hypothetical protein [Gammaproteobacteria bacterium]
MRIVDHNAVGNAVRAFVVTRRSVPRRVGALRKAPGVEQYARALAMRSALALGFIIAAPM